ncbi:MAG: ABC transporter ATP-binding protein [Ferruginibacter sp.]
MFSNYSVKNPLIEVKNLKVVYGNKVIIRDFGTSTIPFVIEDISRSGVEQGQVVAILGRSGSGKSTFFKALSGIVQPAEGTITIPDKKDNTRYVPVREGDLGFVQQNYPLSRNQTVMGMLLDATRQGEVPAGERKAVIEKYLEDWGLIDQRNLAPSQLSGGQKQRVAIIEQLLCSHFFMIFDEPFSGLDVVNIAEVKASFEKISTSNEINTIIFSTHDLELAVEIADLIYIVGYERNENNKPIPGGTLVACYDLKKMNIAWKPFSAEHKELVDQIRTDFYKFG